MNPLARATAATLALVGGSMAANDAQQAPPKRVLNSVLDEDFIPPWRDDYTHPPTIPPTLSPTLNPTLPPTGEPTTPPTEFPTQAPIPTNAPTLPPPTNAPTPAPPTNPPTKAPVEILVGAGAITTKLEDHYETSCTLLPEIGNFVTETLDIEYFLYLSDVEGSLDDADLQGIVDGSIEPRLHEALVDAGLGCDNSDFLNKYVMVDLSTSGRDLIGSECVVDDDFSLGNNVTDCYTVWGQVEATMWFSPRRRQLQEVTTPFGDREAFSEFTQWMEEAMDSLAGYEIAETDATVVKASFRGFANANEFDEATEVDLQKDLGVDITAAFTDSALSADDGGISLAWGLVAIVVGSLVLIMAIVVVALRRKKNRKAFMEHVQVVEDLALDSKDEIDNVCDIVDDESLFKQDKPLPEKYHVKLESADHDYRWIGEERNQSPIFVATERNKEFRDHLATLKRKKEQEVAAQQYEMAML
mmetsp:Transcript_7897/g.19394  ORF Transcript_7897/g.19394 Transcript_7897/m.19394 type:complete len:472 (-) Transcript_7897:250-1665(-)